MLVKSMLLNLDVCSNKQSNCVRKIRAPDACFAAAIENLEDLLVPSITLTEVFKNVLRQRDEESALTAIAHMKQGKVIPLDSELAIDAGNYGVLHKLPLADSIIFASAQKYNATIWTQDADFKGLPNVKYFPAKTTIRSRA